MSIAVMTSSTTFWYVAASKVSSSRRNFIRLSEARLQDELSSDMNSLQGLDAVIRPVSGLVCQSLIVSSYWMPGSAHSHAALAIFSKSSLASTVSMTSPLPRALRPNFIALLDCSHELISDAHRVIGVLVLHGDDVLTVQVHVEACVAQRPDLVLLVSFGLDELLDVGVVHIKDHHLGCPSRGPAALDGAGRRVRAPHEADWATRRPTRRQQLLGTADAGEVYPGAGAALEDEPLFSIPVEDRVDRVVNGQDETR